MLRLLLAEVLMPIEIKDREESNNVHLLENDALGVGGTTEGRELESSSEGLLLVVLVSPTVLTASGAELASGLETSWFSFTCCRRKQKCKLISDCNLC